MNIKKFFLNDKNIISPDSNSRNIHIKDFFIDSQMKDVFSYSFPLSQ